MRSLDHQEYEAEVEQYMKEMLKEREEEVE